MTVEPQPASPTFARSALTARARRTVVYIYKNIYIYIYMTKIFPHCTISVGLAPLADYSIRSIIVINGTGWLSAFCMTEWVESMGVASGCGSKKVYYMQ